jgi:uncharacterized protein YcfL
MKTTLTSHILGLGLAAAGALFSGCATVNTVERAQPIAQRDMVQDKRVITDAILNSRARIVGVNQSMGPGGLLKVQVEILNTTSFPQAFSYRWEWFDETGTIIETPTSAELTRQIEGKESLFITGVAPRETAKDFRIKFLGASR